MTYVVGAIIVLLLIALVLVFRPPKHKPYVDPAQRDKIEEDKEPVGDLLASGTAQSVTEPDEAEEELELTFDEDVFLEEESRETSEEEELDLNFDKPVAGFSGSEPEEVEELDLILDEEDLVPDEEKPGEKSSEESLAVEQESSEEFDEDIPFIDESDDNFERSGDMAPALADIPEDYAQLDDEETPEELAERLEYFLGTGDEESAPAVEGEAAEPADDSATDEEELGTVEGLAEAEEDGEITETVEEAVEASPETFSVMLQEQVEKLRGKLNNAIGNHEAGALGLLEVALENLCSKQADIQANFAAHEKLQEELKGILKEVQQELPGFQLETALVSLAKGEHEVVYSLLTEVTGQLSGAPQLAARALCQLGRIMEEQGELSGALDVYSKAGECDAENPDCLYATGRLARLAGDADDALARLEKRVDLGQENNEESLELAQAEHELAKVLLFMDETERAEKLLASARERMEKLGGADYLHLGPVLHDLGTLHDSAGRYEEAEPLYRKALAVTEQAFGPEDPRLATTLNKLAGLYEEVEKEEEAGPLYAKALEIKQKVLGENHPDVGSIMGHLANQLKRKGRYDEAEPMYLKSLEIAEAALGKDHPNLAMVYNDIAELYSDMGNEEQASYFQERAFASFGLPGMGDGFVEMEKDTGHDEDDDNDQTIAGS